MSEEHGTFEILPGFSGDIDAMTREELSGLLGRLKDLYDDVLTQEPADDESDEYLDWVEGLEALDDLMDDITDRLEE
ncbi:MAG: hypothetical protein IJR97_00195 [Clostridia bacterium]|nr:hypothetical protein [Clostridia bacterium]